MPRDSLSRLDADVAACRACPRLVAWLAEVQRNKRRAFADQEYWSRPVPGFGAADARLLVLGLAPGAHGANRTGRPFTGDGCGAFLYGALHRAGFASGVEPSGRGDGLELRGARITNAVRCAPPGNRPLPGEAQRCAPYLERELALLPELAVILCLGGFAWQAGLKLLRAVGAELPRPRPSFGHGSEFDPGGAAPTLVGSFHPSQLNTNTGRLTPAMMDRVLARVVALAGETRGARSEASDRAAPAR